MVGMYENLKIHRYITAQFIIKLDGALRTITSHVDLETCSA